MSEEHLGRTDRCAATLETLIHEGDPLMKPLSQFALAELYRNHGDTPKALAMFKQLESSGAYAKHGHGGKHSQSEGSGNHHSS
jgi:hypothetical protein